MTTLPPNAQALLAAAIAAESPALLALVGDCVEEQGGCGDGWRRMAEAGKWPLDSDTFEGWWFWTPNTDQTKSWGVPELMDAFVGSEKVDFNTMFRYYPTLAAALVACAAAYVAAKEQSCKKSRQDHTCTDRMEDTRLPDQAPNRSAI